MVKEFKKLRFLTKRNIKLYFRDKMTFFVSLLTPMILVVLFLTFLKTTYESSLINAIPEGFEISSNLIDAFSGAWLFSSIMAVSCITVAFCSNLMVEDKVKKISKDFSLAPIKKSTIDSSYVVSNFVTTFLVCLVLFAISLIYLLIVGWYISFLDIILILADMTLNILFGSLLMSIISLFVNSQGVFSGICTLISSMYGFICGAYMPIATMGSGMQAFVSFIPGTYSTVLFRKFYMNGILNEMGKTLPSEVVSSINESFDGTFKFFGTEVSTLAMFLVMIGTCVLLFGLFVLLVNLKNRKKK